MLSWIVVVVVVVAESHRVQDTIKQEPSRRYMPSVAGSLMPFQVEGHNL